MNKKINIGKLKKIATKKPIIIILILLVAVAAYIWKSPDFETLKARFFGAGVAEGKIEVHYIDVGQGDAALIITENGSVLIDAGTTDSKDRVATYVKNRVNSLDYMILSHPHEDHIGGAPAVISETPVKNIVMPNKTADSTSFDKLLDAIERSDAKLIAAERGQVFTIGDLKISILSPIPGNEYEETNDVSVVCHVTFGSTSFLFTGDAEKLVENEILDAGLNVKSTVLKMGHHGSSTSSSEKFFKAVDPEFAVISCGADNSYGHPHRESIALLNKYNVDYFRTDKDGTIVFTSDGKTVSLTK